MFETDRNPSRLSTLRRRWGTPAALVGTCVLVAGLAIAATGIASAGDTSDPAATDRERLHLVPGPGLLAPFGIGIHGEMVVRDPDGGYQTVLTQRGKVTDVSADSITVESSDGYEHTYDVTDDTAVNGGRDGIGDVEQGHTVQVVAQRESGGDTAVQVGDLTTLRDLGRHWWPHRPGWQERGTPDMDTSGAMA